MGEALPPGEKHEIFTHWAQEQGVNISGVAPFRFHGRGLGIAATRRIEAGEELVVVPFTALLTVDSVPATFKAIHDGISVHGLLASFLAFGDPEDLDPYGSWVATWPPPADFMESMPILWPTENVSSGSQVNGHILSTHGICPLPPEISGQWNTRNTHNLPPTSNSGLLTKQKTRFERDWAKVTSAIPDADRERYMYYWLIVNTRTFYHERPGQKKEETAREDRMALCPFADYFNHADADEGCEVSISNGSYRITSRGAYEPGKEIYVSYGNHSNDFLLTEYGFILPSNESDSLSIDALLLPLLPPQQRALLDEASYLENYTLTHDGLCHRTEVAVRTQTLSAEHWQLYVAGRDGELPIAVREREERDADVWVWRFVLKVGLKGAEEVLRAFGTGVDRDPRQAVMVRRWAQIRDMLEGVRRKLRLGEDVWDGG